MLTPSGIHHVTAIASDPQRTLDFYAGVLGLRFVKRTVNFDDERIIAFKDPDGLLVELVAHPSAEQRSGWGHGPISAEHAIRGVYAVTLWEEGHTQTAELLTHWLGFRLIREQGSIYRYAASGGVGQIIDLRVVPGLWHGVMGAGIVHHVAFRAASEAIQMAVHDALAASGYNITPQLDRDYFRSVYFREPGGVLFEIATDTPGFTIDEPLDQLGRTLKLPAWLEPRRFEIEALLPNIHLPIDLPGPNQ